MIRNLVVASSGVSVGLTIVHPSNILYVHLHVYFQWHILVSQNGDL